jgi:hypothetical protein
MAAMTIARSTSANRVDRDSIVEMGTGGTP